MDEADGNQNLSILSQLKAQYNSSLNRTLQFLISVSLLSVFLCFSSGFSMFPNSFNIYFNTCLFSYLTNTLFSRKYMFLICNGILALLAKCSLVSYSSSDSESAIGENLSTISSNHLSVIEAATSIVDVEDDQLAISTTQSLELEGTVEPEEKEEKAAFEEEEEEEGDKQGESGRETNLLAEECESSEAMITEDEWKEEETNTEELNRRFEEFIRKMKEEIRIEAQQQLIAV